MAVYYTNVSRKGNDLLVRIVDDNGNRSMIKHKFKPILYLSTNKIDNVEKRGLMGEMLVPKQFDSMYDAEKYLKEYADVVNADIYGQTSWEYQFIAHRFQGALAPSSKLMKIANLDIEVFSGSLDENGEIRKGPFPHPTIEDHTFKGSKVRVENYLRDIKRNHQFIRDNFDDSYIDPILAGDYPLFNSEGGLNLNMDAAFPISMLQLQNMLTNKYVVWGLPSRKDRGTFEYDPNDPEIGGENITYREFTNEADMLRDFLLFWESEQYDGWTGFNIEGFDSPYLVRRIEKVLGESWCEKLSPWGIIKKRFVKDKKGGFATYDFVGCETLDFRQIYMKHTYTPRERYSLDWLSYVELGEKKLNYSESKSLNNLYYTNYVNMCRYGIKDVRLVKRLNDKLQLIELMFVLAYRTKSNFKDGLGTVTPWLNLCYWKLYESGRIPRIMKPYDGDTNFEGAFVLEVMPNVYVWVISKDLNSLYPHIIQQYNLGIDTMVLDKHERRDIILGMVAELEAYSKNMTTPMNKRQHAIKLKDRLMLAIDERLHVVDELVALGKFEFNTLKQYNVSFTPNVQFFRNDKISFLSEIMREIYASRKGEKAFGLKHDQFATWCEEIIEGHFNEESARKSRYWDEERFWAKIQAVPEGDVDAIRALQHDFEFIGAVQDVLQQGLKILMNAGYGAISNVWFKEYFKLEIAEAITTSGQLINKWNGTNTDKWMNDQMGTYGIQYTIGGDTDSNYVTFGKVVEKYLPNETNPNKITEFLDAWEKEHYHPMTVQWAQELCETMNGYEQRMFWEREVIASKAIWRAKKMYCMCVYDSEGVKFDHGKIKVIGLEARKSTTPEWCRNKLMDCYRVALQGTEEELQDLVASIKQEYMELPIDEISRAQGVSDIEKWLDSNGNYISGTHFAAKACIAYNKLVAQHPELSLNEIESGDKPQVIMLKSGNPIGETYFAFPDFLPPEFDLERWIDRQTMFEKTFLEPLQSILDPIGWSSKKVVNIMKLFGRK